MQKIGESERLSPIFISSGFGIGTGAGYGTGCGTGIGGGVGAILVLKCIYYILTSNIIFISVPSLVIKIHS